MKRTGEKTIIIIASICNLIAIFLTSIAVIFLKNIINDPKLVEEYLNDPTVLAESNGEVLTIQEFQDAMDIISPYINGFAWLIIGTMVISLILGLVAFKMMNKKEKVNTAGILLILSGVLGGILSLTAILYYVAAIMCFVRKPRVSNDLDYPSQQQ